MIKVEGLTRCSGELVAVNHLDLEIFAEGWASCFMHDGEHRYLVDNGSRLFPNASGSSWCCGSDCGAALLWPTLSPGIFPGGETCVIIRFEIFY